MQLNCLTSRADSRRLYLSAYNWRISMAYYEYYPKEFILLQDELFHHPELMTKLAEVPAEDLGERLATIATHCGMLVDGYLDERGLATFADILTRKLYEKRSLIILPS